MNKHGLPVPGILISPSPVSSFQLAGDGEMEGHNEMEAIRIHGRGGPAWLVYEDMPPPG
jgi:hypothetical protein